MSAYGLTRVRRYPGALSLDPAQARERSILRRVKAAYALLFFNCLTYTAGGSIIALPSKVGKILPQGALPLALLILLTVNPKLKIRPNVFLCLVGLIVADGIFTSIQVNKLGTYYRTARFAEYLCGLWLLTPWWGRRDMLLFRLHLRLLYITLSTVFLGLCISPGRALSFSGRLAGVIWPIFTTQVAEQAAVAAGLTILLWLGHRVNGRAALLGVTFTVFILLMTHTRTALSGLITGILVGGISIFAVNSRVRKFFAVSALIASVAIVTLAGFITTWLARGEGTQGLTSLTGRTDFWALVLNEPRSRFQEIFGFGLSNASINGLPIDSNWLSAYQQMGLWGLTVCIMMVAFLIVAAFFHPPGLVRALVLFLAVYCLLASFTEDAFSGVSIYLLHLVIAASILMPPLVAAGRPPLDRDMLDTFA